MRRHVLRASGALICENSDGVIYLPDNRVNQCLEELKATLSDTTV